MTAMISLPSPDPRKPLDSGEYRRGFPVHGSFPPSAICSPPSAGSVLFFSRFPPRSLLHVFTLYVGTGLDFGSFGLLGLRGLREFNYLIVKVVVCF